MVERSIDASAASAIMIANHIHMSDIPTFPNIALDIRSNRRIGDPKVHAPGGRFFVGLVAHNSGASAAEDVFIQDRLPQGAATVDPVLLTVASKPLLFGNLLSATVLSDSWGTTMVAGPRRIFLCSNCRSSATPTPKLRWRNSLTSSLCMAETFSTARKTISSPPMEKV